MNATSSGLVIDARAKSLKIDAIRFLAAFWVVAFHFQPPEFSKFFPARLAVVGRVLQAVGVAVFDGPAAVIVFFVISGFCIHSAYHRDATLKPINYFASRFVRIGLPLVIALMLVQALDAGSDPVQSVLWSLYCEMIYYALYPVLRANIRYMGEIIAAAFICGITLIFMVHRGHIECPDCVRETYGIPGTALLFSGAWILGAFVAEHQRGAHPAELHRRYSRLTELFHRGLSLASNLNFVWLVALRISVIAAGTLMMALWSSSSHKPAFLPFVGPDISLFVFQLLASIWIAAETMSSAKSWVWTWLGGLGAWSYSLYLCHKTAIVIVNASSFSTHPGVVWFAQFAVALAISYGFYKLVERPSHLLAKRLRRVEPASAPTIVA